MGSEAYPLHWPDGWPRLPVSQRKVHSPFKTTFDKGRRQLLDELRLLGARDIVISSWLPLRQDGQPYASAASRRIDDPGVAVYFTLRKRQMVMARDAYWRIEDNLRSIGLAVSHLRGLERHGGAVMMERAFEGFAALPAPGAKPWWHILGLSQAAGKGDIEATFRKLARERHPDHGGSDAMMAELNAARDAGLRACAP